METNCFLYECLQVKKNFMQNYTKEYCQAEKKKD